MIFEFLKNLFWKADEGNRKRKSDDIVNDLSAKRRCTSESNINTNNCITDNLKTKDKIMDYPNKRPLFEDFNRSRNRINTKLDFLQMEQSKLLPLLKVNSTESNKCILQKDLHLENTRDQVILFKTHRLAEKKQYRDMILNFIPSKVPFTNKNSHNRMNQNNLFKNINLCENQMSYNLKYDSSMLKSSDCSLLKCQKCLSVSKSKDKEINCSKLLINSPIEIIKTNSLKDELSSRKVCKQDFIFQISKKYSERVEQCQKEVQELEKITFALSKHNQLLREASLDDQLSRSMKLCKVFLDEREITEEESKLPELTTEMKKCINIALTVGPSDEILAQSFGLSITRKDIQTLAGLNWLNDEIINFYMNLLIIRGENKNYPSVYAMNTFFYPKLTAGGHVSLKRWTRKIDIFSKDILVIPIHLGIHWCMSIVDFRNKSIKYYDSMGSPNHKCLQLLKQYIYDESVDKKKIPFNFEDWIFQCIKDIPQQMNGSDCGVFSCMFAEYICANKTLNFSQDDMPYFRNKMIYEILSVKLL